MMSTAQLYLIITKMIIVLLVLLKSTVLMKK